MSKKRKNHVTLPRSFDPGPNHPRETLAYLSAAEHDLIRKLTDGKWNRGPKGVKSYADDSASSKGVERKDSNGGLGQGGQGSGRSSGAGGGSKGPGGPSGPNSGPSRSSSSSSAAGGGNKSSPSSGAGRDSTRGIGQGAGGQAVGRGGTSTATGRAADAAKANAARSSTSGTSSQWGGPRVSTSPSTTKWGGPSIPQPSRAYPSQFNNDMLAFNADRIAKNNITDPRAKMDSLHNLTQFSDVSYDPDAVSKIRDRLGYTPVGIRANNPGNLLNSKWQKDMPGYTGPLKSSNGLTYASYSDPRYGLAAQNELLGRYSDMGRNTINSVVDRYAPADENNSVAANRSYKEHLAASTGWGRNDTLTREQVQSLGPYKTSFENGGELFAGGPFGGAPSVSGGTQVAGIANAGLSQAQTQARAAREAEAARTMQNLSAAKLPSDPRLGVPRGAYPAGPTQGPQRYAGPLDSIPKPQSIGMSAPASAFANDPRLSMPLGGLAQARQPSQVATDPRVSQTPVGAFPAAQKPASVFAKDPRLDVSQGAYPAAPQKEVKLAWNVPPIGGSIGPAYGDAMSIFGTNRPLPKGPAAQPGTIHSQTASATSAPPTPDAAPSFWQQAGDLYNTASTAVQNKVQEAKATPEWKFAQDHPRLAEFALKMMMGGGGNPNSSGLGNPQDRGGSFNQYMPQMAQMAPQAASMQQGGQVDPLQVLTSLQQNMIAQGASPEELAYVQSLIDELSNSQVA